VKALTSIGLAAGLAVSLSTAASATPTLVGTTTDPTGINGLVVDGTTYDVTFSTTTLNSFSYPSTLSDDANFALVSALNALSVTELGNVTPRVIYVIDVDDSLSSFEGPACNVTSSPCPVGDWQESIDSNFTGLGSLDSGIYYVAAADFTAMGTVPEPFSLSLFGAGLLGAAAMRRWKPRKAA
jgi:hypothetical protein